MLQPKHRPQSSAISEHSQVVGYLHFETPFVGKRKAYFVHSTIQLELLKGNEAQTETEHFEFFKSLKILKMALIWIACS